MIGTIIAIGVAILTFKTIFRKDNLRDKNDKDFDDYSDTYRKHSDTEL